MVTDRYYTERLAAERLKRCYEIAPPRVRQYLRAEVEHLLEVLKPTDVVLELGCGYGRVLVALAGSTREVVGIDTALASLRLARTETEAFKNCHLVCMDAAQLGFREKAFDKVVCIQNGISAFHIDVRHLIEEAIRVVKPTGTVMFSTYSAKFWEDRLDWFERQAEAGLLGEIDQERTGNGAIVCRDGFTATTVSSEEFLAMGRDLKVAMRLVEVDNSSLFCEMEPRR